MIFAIAAHIALVITATTFTADDLYFLANTMNGGMDTNQEDFPYTQTFFDEEGNAFATMTVSE